MIIVGQKEIDTNTLTLRKNNSKEMETFSLNQFLEFINDKIKNKSLDK